MPRNTVIFLFLVTNLMAFGLKAQVLDGWSFKAQRAAIQPGHWVDVETSFQGAPTLAIAGLKAGHDNGSWVHSYPVTAGAEINYRVYYRAEDVDELARSILTTLIWLDKEGNQIGPKEFPARGLDQDGWHSFQQVYMVPHNAVTCQVELIYRWDGDGKVHFSIPEISDAQLQTRKVRLATVHHKPHNSTLEGNWMAFEQLIEEAALEEADIVCLPEAMNMAGTGRSYVEAAESIPGPTSQFLGSLARKHQMYIVAGLLEVEGEVVYNTAVLMDREGNLSGKYRKVCLPREEIEGGVSPGSAFPVFETDFGKVGLMICWDVAFPEPARQLAMQGAEVIMLPIWGGNRTLAQARAIENQVYLVSSTYSNHEEEMRTAVFDLEGKMMDEGSDRDPVIVVEVDLNKQKLWPFLGEFKNRIAQEMPSRKAMESSASSLSRQ